MLKSCTQMQGPPNGRETWKGTSLITLRPMCSRIGSTSDSASGPFWS